MSSNDSLEQWVTKVDEIIDTMCSQDFLNPSVERIEYQAHLANYLCIVVSGFVEQSSKKLVRDYVESHTRDAPPIVNLIDKQLERIWGLNKKKFLDLLSDLDQSWSVQIKTSMSEELDALESVNGLRNKIAHGGSSTATMNDIRIYYNSLKILMQNLEALLKAQHAVSE
jgi:hypothetical protein